MDFHIVEGQYQEKFLFSKAKFPCMIAAVGTGKTLCLLTKVVQYCQEFPGTSALVVRREFTDLRDSTMKDFEQYFGLKIGSDKNCGLENGSMIMFRHADELGVLKNVNLGCAAIEQAEEFESDVSFQMIRDRLRQQNGSTVHPLIVIANACGHNWVWRLWINRAETVNTIETATGQYEFIAGEYHCLTANSFANVDHLPPDFIADLRRKEKEAPKHFQQFIMNSFEEIESDDLVFSFSELMKAKALHFPNRLGFNYRIGGFDVGRYGSDASAAVTIEQVGPVQWKILEATEWLGKDLSYTTGRIFAESARLNIDAGIIDEQGIGGGPLDFITQGGRRDNFSGFKNIAYPSDKNQYYANARTENAFKLKEMIAQGRFSLVDVNEKLVQELMTLKYKYTTDGRKILISKEAQKAQGIASQNLADSLIMAVSLIDGVMADQEIQYGSRRMPQYSAEENLFKSAGVR